ncbi:MAG: YceI family protein, partial [Planctomycetes bacterium]|nr:YceI family protein [Planctomycetota bacterium]
IAEAAPEEPAGAPTEPAATPAPAEVPAPPAPKRGLFSFKLAGGGPDFTHTQRYQVIGSLSRVGFDAKSTLHDFSGVTSKVEGTVVARLDQDDPHASATIRAAAATLKTGVDGRDEEMCKVLGAEEHPWIQFDLAGLVVTASDPEAKTYKGVGHGSFTIKGVTREVEVPVELSVDASRRLVASGEAKLNLLDFGLEVPSVAGAIKVEDEVKVWLSLRLRLLGDAEEGAR